ncbi:MAG: serine kinase [Albidovulum sp.]|nr:serine kinase [Albidovulum sp.]MDE0530450.1 serine kinase [Albidovulum sp.]
MAKIRGAPPSNGAGAETVVHASAVSWKSRAALLLGRSGSGKSRHALEMMAMGAGLVADDRTRLRRRGNFVFASAPESILGKIEARGVGILRADYAGEAKVVVAVDLDTEELERLPPRRSFRLLSVEIDLVLGAKMESLAAKVIQHLKRGQAE